MAVAANKPLDFTPYKAYNVIKIKVKENTR